MLNTLFQGVFTTSNISSADITGFLACIATALLIGGFLAFVYRFKSRASKSFLTTLILLPSIVAVVILMVNGNIGAGIAVAGAFSLIRFRSVPGNARDIASIFLAMGAGLICGMGYLGFAVLFTLILGMVILILNSIDLDGFHADCREKSLRIAIPEDLNYAEVFEELLAKYTQKHELISVKTANMGSIFKLNYNITLNDPAIEKEFIDALRVRNGNLEICISRQEVNLNEL